MSKPIPLCRALAIAPSVRFIDALGGNSARLLETARISPSVMESWDGLVPLRQALAFMHCAARREGIADFGLRVGGWMQFGELGELASLLSPEMTLQTAIAVLQQVVGEFSAPERLSLHCQGDRAFFHHHLAMPQCDGRRHGDGFTLMLMLQVLRFAMGPRWHPTAVLFPAAEADRRAEYERELQTRVLCIADYHAIVFDRRLLDERLGYCDAPKQTDAALRATLRANSPAGTFRGSVAQTIRSLLPRGKPRLADVADVAGVSVRGLQRQLAEAGCSYMQILEETRIEMARQMLRGTRMKILDIAYELGYSDPANLTRAFRRLTGRSPQDERRALIPR